MAIWVLAVGPKEAEQQFGEGLFPIVFLFASVNSYAYAGLWTMRRWGVIVLSVLFGLSLITNLAAYGLSGLWALALPMAFLALGFYYYKNMSSAF